eukprot:GHVT01014204.1.p1 GENE.GHVT01014204.1~~GHVT01014204.1.p1  ORF type:complete len:159 (-),score=20.67 GHVT01014204.1:304-780(-)
MCYDVARPLKSNQDKIAHVTNAPLGAGAVGHLAPPPPHKAALPMAFPLVTRATHSEEPAATKQLRRDYEECLHEIAASNLKPTSRRLGQYHRDPCTLVLVAAIELGGALGLAVGIRLLFTSQPAVVSALAFAVGVFLLFYGGVIYTCPKPKEEQDEVS